MSLDTYESDGTERESPLRVAIYHNILWAKYKGGVFSQLSLISKSHGVEASFIQIAETDSQRTLLSKIDPSYHNYPFRLLFRGSYNSLSMFRVVVALTRDLLKYPCDLVLIPNYDLPEYWAMLLLCMLLRRKRAVICDATIYDRPKSKWKEIAKRFFFARCDGIFCYGTRSKEYLMGYGVTEAKINVRRQAAALLHGYSSAEVMAHYATTSEDLTAAPRFLFVGRLSREKGLDDLLRAFKLVREKLPGAVLDIIGAGRLHDSLAQQIIDQGQRDVVTLLGSRDLKDIVPYMFKAVALVLPSHSEPWGLVVNEALSYGCPVVVSSHCGCVPELVIDGVTGYQFVTGNVEDLARAMTAVVALSDRRAATARACIEVVSPFSASNSARQMLDGCMRILRTA